MLPVLIQGVGLIFVGCPYQYTELGLLTAGLFDTIYLVLYLVDISAPCR